MTIGQTIKRLRKQQDLTQENLAEHLGISYQAVSKWENGSALPDITLVVPLANFFGVTTDELFSHNEKADEETYRRYEERYNQLNLAGDNAGCIAVTREALALYPRESGWMWLLALSLGMSDSADDRSVIDEITALCERILRDPDAGKLRYCAIQQLCHCYTQTGQRERAIALSRTLPTIGLCDEMMRESILEGHEKTLQLQENICFHAQRLYATIISLAHHAGTDPDDCIALAERANAVLTTLYDDGNLLFAHVHLYHSKMQLAKWQMKKGDTNAAMGYLRQAKNHAIAADKAHEKPARYTARPVNTVTFDPEKFAKNFPGTYREHFAKGLNHVELDGLRKRNDFIALRKESAD